MTEPAAASSSAAASDITIHVRAPKDAKVTVEISPSKTIKQLKELIATKVEDCPSDRQRLIYSGRVLKDDDTVATYKVQSGNTIHLVKSSAQTEAAPAAARVPEQLSAGQQIAGNPLAPLMNAMHPGLGGVNPFAQMGVNQNDPNMWQNMMQSPEFQQQMQAMLSNPAVIDQLIAQSPELRALGPQARQIMQSPMFRQMLTNPQAMQFAMNAGMARGAGGMNLAGTGMAGGGAQPGLFGMAQQQQQQQQAAGTGTGNGDAAQGAQQPDMSALFGAGSPFGQLPAGTAAPGQAGMPAMPDFAALQNMFGGMGTNPFAGMGAAGGAAAATAPPARAGPPPEERFADQLAALAGMGFNNARQNIRALLATGGNVEHAVTYILEDGGLD